MNKTEDYSEILKEFRERFTFGGITGIVALKTDNATEVEAFLIKSLKTIEEKAKKDTIDKARIEIMRLDAHEFYGEEITDTPRRLAFDTGVQQALNELDTLNTKK